MSTAMPTEPTDLLKEDIRKKSRRARRRRHTMAQAQPSSTPSQTMSGVAANVSDRSASTKPNPWLQPPQSTSVPATPKQETEQLSARHTQPHQSADRPAQYARNFCHETEFLVSM